MSNVKERIIGAVTIMSEEEAEKVWNLIQASFILSDVEEIEPDPEELEALRRKNQTTSQYLLYTQLLPKNQPAKYRRKYGFQTHD